MWRAIGAVVTAPLSSPSFFHTYVADVFTSMVKVFQDLLWTICFFLSGDFIITELDTDEEPHPLYLLIRSHTSVEDGWSQALNHHGGNSIIIPWIWCNKTNGTYHLTTNHILLHNITPSINEMNLSSLSASIESIIDTIVLVIESLPAQYAWFNAVSCKTETNGASLS